MTFEPSTVLAVFALCLMAIVVVAPKRVAAAASGAPGPFAVDAVDAPRPAAGADPRTTVPVWPEFIDPRAPRCDAGARLALVDALASLRSEWSRTLLTRALDDEDEPVVRRAIVEALAVRQGQG